MSRPKSSYLGALLYVILQQLHVTRILGAGSYTVHSRNWIEMFLADYAFTAIEQFPMQNSPVKRIIQFVGVALYHVREQITVGLNKG